MKTTALIVTYNRLDKLKKCWLATSKEPYDHIVIVDNCSSDKTAEWLQTLNDPRVTVMHLVENTGGAGGFKKGAEFISSNIRTDWVFIYDDDASPSCGLLTRFYGHDLNGISAVSCRVVDSNDVDCKMNKPFIKLPKGILENINYFFNPDKYIPVDDKITTCKTLSFVGTVIRGDVLASAVDFIHEELFLYYDDVYFSHHLSLSGHVFKYMPDLVFVHDIPPLNKSITPTWKVYYLIRNLIFAKKYFKLETPYSTSGILFRILKAILNFPNQNQKIQYLKYIVLAVIDGFRFKTGKRH